MYRKQDISIEWLKNNFRFRSKIDLEKYLEEQESHLNFEDFQDVVLDTVTLIRDVATDNNLEDYESWKKDLVKENFLTDDELSHISILSSSNVDMIRNVNQEILTKRNVSDIHKINAYSLLISFEIRGDTSESVKFEVSKKQLAALIEDLESSLSAIEELEKN